MSFKKIISLAIVTVIMVISGCKKYPDGPTVSFRFKSTRIANEWVFGKIEVDGVDYTADLDYLTTGVYISFSKGGDFKIVVPEENNTWVYDTIRDTTYSVDTVIVAPDTTYDTIQNVAILDVDSTEILSLQEKFEDAGVWIFEKKSKKEFITIQRDNPNYDVRFYIKELKEKRFVYTYTEIHPDKLIDGNNEDEDHYVELKPVTDYLRETVRGEK